MRVSTQIIRVFGSTTIIILAFCLLCVIDWQNIRSYSGSIRQAGILLSAITDFDSLLISESQEESVDDSLICNSDPDVLTIFADQPWFIPMPNSDIDKLVVCLFSDDQTGTTQDRSPPEILS